MEIRESDESLVFHIADNGIGFEIDQALESKLSLEHIGLLGMQERAEMLNGNLLIDSEPGKGTTVDFAFSLFPSEVCTIARM